MIKYFEEITDKRQQWKVKHKLQEIVITTICAVISGCDTWEDISYFCKVKKEWFCERFGLELKNGLASHDTYQRVFAMIDPKEFEKCFVSWVESIKKESDEKEIVNIDGKTIRNSKEETKKAVHMVSAWASKNQLVLGQIRTEEKSNEITAIPELLDMIDVAGAIVTIDAMGCQKNIAKKVIDEEADYVFGLKGNQSSMHEDVKLYFKEIIDDRSSATDESYLKTMDKGHGRIEKRQYYLETDIEWLEEKNKWTGLKGIGAVKSTVTRNGNTTAEIRYFLTSLTDVQLFAKSVRAHWSIENKLHWCLDVVFKEDYNRTRKDNGAENFAIVRHIVLSALKNYELKGVSLARKRRMCQYDCEFMANVLLSIR